MSSPTKPSASIDDLPPEMISELFKHLHPKDLAACSMVNRRWYSIYAAFKLHRLVVTDYRSFYDFTKWHSSNRPIQKAEQCRPAMFRHLAGKPLLSNLKHLAVSGSFAFDLNELNGFPQLIHLEINTDLSKEEIHLNLLRLKVLAFHKFNRDCPLSIDCPELSTLLYQGDANLLDVKHLETIRELETCLVGQKLTPFKNVEYLITEKFQAISKATLLSLPKLREFNFKRRIEDLVERQFENQLGEIDNMKRTLNEFVGEAKNLRGSDFRFTFCGFQLTNVNVDQIDFGVEVDVVESDEEDDEVAFEYVSNEYVYMKNYHLIEPGALPFVRKVNYTCLLSSVTGEFPHCFSQKFTGIEEVQVDGVVKDPDHLLWFLKSLRLLTTLELANAEFNQKFYDRLPTAARSLVILRLRGDQENQLQLNFDFVGKFSCIEYLSINQPLTLRSIDLLVRSLGGVKEIGVNFQSRRDRWIRKCEDSTVWEVREEEYVSDSLFKTEYPDEIVNFLMS